MSGTLHFGFGFVVIGASFDRLPVALQVAEKEYRALVLGLRDAASLSMLDRAETQEVQ